jgi:hypothetical protein
MMGGHAGQRMRAPETTPEDCITYFSLCGLLNSELTNWSLEQAVIRMCKKVI